MVKWGTLRNYILSGILKDADGTTYLPENLKIYARWACVELALHTAQATSKEWNCDGKTSQFPLPADMVDSVEKSGLVYLLDGATVKYIDAVHLQAGTSWPVASPTTVQGYWEWPTGVLTLGFIPKSGQKIGIQYFKIWDAPESDNDELAFPQYCEHPFAFFVAAYAMDAESTQSSSIRQWNTKSDSGSPEDNPLQRQSEYFMKQAHRLLSKIPSQDRENYYRRDFQ